MSALTMPMLAIVEGFKAIERIAHLATTKMKEQEAAIKKRSAPKKIFSAFVMKEFPNLGGTKE